MELLEWDARTYDTLPLPHERWGVDVRARLGLTGTETVLDLGCGTGRDTQQLLAQLPGGRVVAVDGSAQMLDQLRARLPAAGNRLVTVQADLREPLLLAEPVDAAFSVATLHWLPDHETVFRSVRNALRPGGRFVAEAGGYGNVSGFLATLGEVVDDDGARFWNFADVEETRQRLRAAGFSEIEVDLVPDPARLARGAQLEAYLATVMLGAHLRELPQQRRRAFVHQIAERMPEPLIDYVRLQISAVRAR
ncbi:class I SAM-dependent methyltransferase [Micromonospora sp. NPDC049204]|uniref:class I SAM-dependent methyltransferase n=1 Tax=unclassified Micromonospora TaxID=2617518 RepID=UPI00340FFF51